jgi:1,4-alpha-glucan branching enzyme
MALAGSALAQSVHPGLGANPYESPEGTGVSFRVWAPNAASLHVTGTFIDWQTPGIAMAADPSGGTWSVDVPGILPGERYKFILNGSLWRTDPRAREYGASANNSGVILAEPDAPAPFTPPAPGEWVVYELHIGTFRDPDPGDGVPATFLDAIGGLDHLVDLGVNAVSVLPFNEFLTSRSWGYNPAGLFAIERDYGGRDAFAAFVDACHARGIAVIVDIVHNHWGTPVGDLWQFDDTSAAPETGGIYFYEDERAATDWGPRPNYDEPAVRAFILDSVSALLDLGVDGFRWDAVNHMVRIDGDGTLIPAATGLLAEAAALIRGAGALNIAENAADEVPGAFDAQWDIAFRSALSRSLSQPNPADRAFNISTAILAVGTASLAYVESHDSAGVLNAGAQRWPLRVAATNRTLAMTGVALAWLTPAIPMLFQGQEALVTNLWHDNTPLDWAFDESAAQAIDFHRDLIRLRRNLDGVSPALLTTSLTAFATSGFAVVERGTPNAPLVAVANLENASRSLELSVPATGHWYRVLSTADPRYGNPGGGTAAFLAEPGEPVAIDVPPFATVLFAQDYHPEADMDGDGLPNGWEALHFGHPTNALPEADDDEDGADNLHEFLADTHPRDDGDFFRAAGGGPVPGAFLVRFASSSNRVYDIYQSPWPAAPYEPLVLGLPGEPQFTVYTNAVPNIATSRFFQIRARPAP